ncbi:MAG TPA: hypothetical protein VNW71_25855 [Thermoanaerobaculia bacterium]|nr:hypothetical protein [Thermoanaerobaculia bacterium]
MGINVKDFTGTWYVWWVDGQQSFLQKGWKIVLGTTTDGAKEPFLSPEYQVLMGFSILSPNGDGTWTPVFSTQDQQQQPLELLFVDGALRWIGGYNGQPLRIYISACEANTTAGQSTISLYGSTVLGDPDQVGVWGASDRPPGG